MKLIKILVADEDQAREITEVLEDAEANGMLDFPFSVRFTDDLSPSDAKHNFYNEES